MRSLHWGPIHRKQPPLTHYWGNPFEDRLRAMPAEPPNRDPFCNMLGWMPPGSSPTGRCLKQAHQIPLDILADSTEGKLMELLKLTAKGFLKPLLQEDLNASAPKLQLQMRQPQLASWDPKPSTLNLNDSYLGGRGSRLRPQLSASPARQHPNLSPKCVGASKTRGTPNSGHL